MNTELSNILQQMNELSQNARTLAGNIILDQELFFMWITKLKLSLQSSARLSSQNKQTVLAAIHSLEQLVEHGQFPIFGKVFVSKELYNSYIEQLRNLLQ